MKKRDDTHASDPPPVLSELANRRLGIAKGGIDRAKEAIRDHLDDRHQRPMSEREVWRRSVATQCLFVFLEEPGKREDKVFAAVEYANQLNRALDMSEPGVGE